MAKSERKPALPRGEDRESHKRKAIDLAVSTIEKQFGKGAILAMTEESVDREVDAIPSGSASLDLALGVVDEPDEMEDEDETEED